MRIHLPAGTYTSQDLYDLYRAVLTLERIFPDYDVVVKPLNEVQRFTAAVETLKTLDTETRQMRLGWSNFALGHSTKDAGNSYSTLDPAEVVRLVDAYWDKRRPGTGESDLSRKVIVPVPPEGFFCPPRAKLIAGMPVRAEVVTRQAGEDPYVQTFITPEDAAAWGVLVETPAEIAEVVCYSAEALLENGGTRSTDCDWEIVTLLCSVGVQDPMMPLAMARNLLEKPGGTKGEYTAQQFAEAIWHWSQRGIRIKKANQP